MHAWEMMQAGSATALLPADEFMDGATQAYLYFNRELAVSRDVDHLEALCTPHIFRAIEQDREGDEGGFEDVRRTMGEDAAPKIHTMESYLTMFIMLSHPKHFKEGQNPYTAMAEALQPLEDRQQAPLDKFTTMDDQAEEAVLIKGPPFTRDMVERWGLNGNDGDGDNGDDDAAGTNWPDHVVTASVRFLTKETYPWDADDQQPIFRVDNYEFAAPYTEEAGVGDFRIVDFN